MAFVAAYSKKTGQKQRVPEHWLGHPTLGKDFSKTPRQKAADKAKAPAEVDTPKTPASGDKEED